MVLKAIYLEKHLEETVEETCQKLFPSQSNLACSAVEISFRHFQKFSSCIIFFARQHRQMMRQRKVQGGEQP